MSERKILTGLAIVVAFGGLLVPGYLAGTGQLLTLDGLAISLISLTVAVIFGGIAAPELLEMYPLPPAVDEAIAAHAEHSGGGIPLYMIVWGGLLILTLVEVLLAYLQVPVLVMLIALMGLSIMKAAMIIAYFMHLRFERLSMVLALMPALVMCICLLGSFFPDSFRIQTMGTQQHEPPPAAEKVEHH
jgi:cytochrome c oxidase subunit 4